MPTLGIIEGFYGPAWPDAARADLMRSLAAEGYGFYIYAPKSDSLLRKKWREEWGADYLAQLKKLSAMCRAAGLQFGVGLSPYAFGQEDGVASDKIALEKKLLLLKDIGIDILGLFFDDMYGHDKIAAVQTEVVSYAQTVLPMKTVFCPSYYSDDPVLDRIFGQRPPHYLDDIGGGMSQDVDIVWTGPKVISPDIPAEHLKQVATIIKRPAFIWDNLYANDGPRNCKFLKLKPFAGRDAASFAEAGLWGINPMNQPQLSKIMMIAAKKTVVDKMTSADALISAVQQELSAPLADLLLKNIPAFTDQGLDNIDAAIKQKLEEQFRVHADEPAATEVADWLAGKYLVGEECLTD